MPSNTKAPVHAVGREHEGRERRLMMTKGGFWVVEECATTDKAETRPPTLLRVLFPI
jgi:hypothetical protein